MSDKETIAYIWLTTVFGYGSEKISEIVSAMGSAQNALENGIDALFFGEEAESVRLAFEQRDTSYAEYIFEKCQKENVRILCLGGAEYPDFLAEISSPPAVLYCKGDTEKLKGIPFTVIGTRKCDSEGRKIISEFVPSLQKAGFEIVSGFAEGTEAFIHKSFQKTIAVLPCGINITYPSSNRGLAESICDRGGLVVTEFMHDVRAFKGNFYLRNRLLAGLSVGVMISQASEKSGTSITATCAGEYGRMVYAVPGSIYNPRFRGCIGLIRLGATAVYNPNQIALDFEQLYPDAIHAEKDNSPDSAQKVFVDLDRKKYQHLSDEEKAILCCINGSFMHADEIAMKTGMNIATIHATLVGLELEGFVTRLDGNQFMINE